MPKKNKAKQHKQKLQVAKQKKTSPIITVSPKSLPDREPERKNIPKPLPQIILLGIGSIAIFIASNFWGSSFLANISPMWGYILFLSSNSIVLGIWTWKVVDWIRWKKRFAKRIKTISICSVIIVFVITSPLYADFFIRPQGSIEMPTFVNDSQVVTVHYGKRVNDYMWAQSTVGDLTQKSEVPFSINNEQVFTIHIKENKLFINTSLFAGIENQDQHVFSAPVVIKDNAFDRQPNGWKIHQNNMNLEIDNEDGIPVLLLEYQNPYSIIISGLFVTKMGICKVDNSPDNIFVLGDTLAELGTYRVDRIFIHSIFDLFKSERTYILK